LEWAAVDIRLTRDGRHVLCRDATFIDVSGKSWNISESSWAELSKLDVGSRFAERFAGEPMLTLQECFTVCTQRLNLYLDCKSIDPEQLAKEIVAAGMAHQVIVNGNPEVLARLREASAGKIALITTWRPGLPVPEYAVTNGLAAVEIDAPEMSSALTESFHRAGIKVQAKMLGEWDKPELWEQAIVAGADWLQTDLPEEVLAHALWRRLPKRPVQISLHRGAGRYAPENTLPAFAKAARLGTDFVEFDVRTTQDGAFFLLHDSGLSRTTDGRGPIDKMSANEVRKLSAGIKFGREYASVPVPSLDDFLGAVADKPGLYFDAKSISPEALASALKNFSLVERTVVYQSVEYLTRLKAINPNIRRLPPLRQPEELAALVADVQPYAVDVDWDILSKDLIDRCHAAGIQVFSDALGRDERIEEYLKAVNWGIDLIQTDHPLRLLRAIELREALNAASSDVVKP
jgi:glycerophosphoryl diester phosphodiesterase